ncbi:hypothetical protein MVES1_000999 [Malassezia vespertilionis]|uniref:FAD/NAD(P)-binding domain-containing protein n=1 Tax=Malassezia vespertilionis TaxID=2020962 RepID=A0A2N1JDW5_9BASI|nr:uncharacterized protein MVES1_000999 [Malassezia vespertilionis]PKI84726.1 hypothetical protein MVES_000935 [Malassezia vespertilionis]WFD05667.1 hypothetical protein MVES1_000999 [Malassezia vespertilionis]
MPSCISDEVKNVVVLGGSYGGMHTAMVLAKKLPPTHRVILMERNTHFNHLYVFPRFLVFPGHEHKAFVPYTSIFSESPSRRRAAVLSNMKTGNMTRLEMHVDDDGSGPPIDAADAENAIVKDRLEMESAFDDKHDRKENQIIEVHDLLKGKLRIDDEYIANGDAKDEFCKAEPHLVLCGEVTRVSDNYVTIKQQTPECGDQMNGSLPKKSLWSLDTMEIPYTHLVYALGSHMPDPLYRNSYSKVRGVEWMKRTNHRIRESKDIVIVGGGALGVELATDIATKYKDKNITLIHSRQQLLPNFDIRVHEWAYKQLQKLGVKVVLGHRLSYARGCPRGTTPELFENYTPSQKTSPDGKILPVIICPNEAEPGAEPLRHHIRTTKGLELECDLFLLCTGQQPNSALMAEFSPTSVNPSTRLIRVMHTLQVMKPDDPYAASHPPGAVETCKDCDCFPDNKLAGAESDQEDGAKNVEHFDNIYAIGDVADAFGALNAGYQAWYMGEAVAENILRDIMRQADSEDPTSKLPDGEPVPLKEFTPLPDMLKLTIGGGEVVSQGAPAPDESLPGRPMRPTVQVAPDQEDMYIESVWKGMALADPSDMYI